MLATILAVLNFMSPHEFPELPIQFEMERGTKVYRQKKGIERTLFEDRIALGRWFTGTSKIDTDQAIYFSPAMVSRWLGYLKAKEQFSDDELHRRWQSIRESFDGKFTFIVESFALPKQSDFFELTEGAEVKPETALKARFLVTLPNQIQVSPEKDHDGKPGRSHDRLEPETVATKVMRGFSMASVEHWQWWSLIPELIDFQPEFSYHAPTAYEAVVGDFVRVVRLVQFEVPDLPHQPTDIELRVFVPGKELVARFSRQGKLAVER